MFKSILRKSIILVFAVAVVFVFGTASSLAASAPNATGQVDCKGGAILRKSSSTSSKKVCKLSNNTKLTIKKMIYKKKSNYNAKYRWYYVTANGKTGYIRADLVHHEKYSPVSATVLKTANYRTGAGIKFKAKGKVKKNAAIKVYLSTVPVSSTKGTSSTWYKIKVGNNYRYVASNFISINSNTPAEVSTADVSKPASTMTVPSSVKATASPATGQINSSNGANIRSSASTKSSVVASFANNATVIISKAVFTSKTSTAATDKWYKVSTDGVTGYIRSDLVDNIRYNPETSTVNAEPYYRKGAGTSMATVGTLKKGSTIEVLLEAEPVSGTQGPSSKWYMFKSGSNYYYVCSSYVTVQSKASVLAPKDEASFTADLQKQGFPTSYINKLVVLYRQHPNWSFKAINCGSWATAVTAETKGKYSLIQRSGSSSWVTANTTEVSYYMDPRNFLNESRVFMFENLNYNAAIHTDSVVKKVLSGTQLEANGFKSSWFVTYGAMYNTSPVHLASRARQETGGGSSAINGKGKYNGVVVYNPFNIGAYSTVTDGLKKAYEMGWTTKEASIKGGAQFIGKDYINAGQNTMYLQKFYIKNGAAYHQYMQNIKAPYSESYSTYASYANCGILFDGHSFIIPVYSGMPSSTSL